MIFFVISAFMLYGSGTKEADAAAEEAGYSSPEQLKELIDEQSVPHVLIDVRTPQEFDQGHIPTAVNIPVDEIGADPPDVPKDQLIIVYCRSGNRSARAARILEDAGFTEVVDFGGINRWPYDIEY